MGDAAPLAVPLRLDGPDAVLTFARFGLAEYRTFLAAKALPEYDVSYSWQDDTYHLRTPARFAARLGAAVPEHTAAPLPLADHLFDYQRWVVGMALEAKRYALWLDTGTGKTACYLEWARQVVHRTGGRVLILAPLQIIRQVQDEAARFYGAALPIARLDTREALSAWCPQPGAGVAITNYEKFIPGQVPELRYLAGLVADESAILRTGGGVIKWNLIKSARGIEYKLSCTATPAPNDTMEYASQAAFLEKLRHEGDILWTYFSRDKHGNWHIKPHARQAFYTFMASWSIYLRDPAHFGFGDILATLPPPVVREYRLDLTDVQREWMYGLLHQKGRGLFADDRLGVVERTKLSQLAKGFLYDTRTHTAARMESGKPAFVADLVRQERAAGRQVLVWTVFDAESAIIAEHLQDLAGGVGVLDGKMSLAARQAILDGFRTGAVPVLISKAHLIGLGLNLQHCRAMIFSGWDDSFALYYQAVRRCYRYGQTETVYVHIPYIPELEGLVWSNVKPKEEQFARDVALQERHYRAALAGSLAAVP